MNIRFKHFAVATAVLFCSAVGSVQAQEFKLTHQWKQGADSRDVAARQFVKEVSSKDPSLKFRIYPGASLISNPLKQVDALQDGTVEMSIIPLIYAAGKIPEFSVTILPGAVSSAADAMTLRNSPYAKKLQEVAEANGLHLLTWWWTEGGFVNRARPLGKPDDVKGLKFRGADRTIDSALKEAGASVYSMPSTELYNAMQSGVLDGLLSSYDSLMSMRLYEQSKYATIGGDYTIFVLLQPLVISKKAWDKLTPAQKKIFEDAAQKTDQTFNAEQDEVAKTAVKKFESAGVQVRQMTKPEFEDWLALAKRTSWQDFAKTSPKAKELLDALHQSRGK
ncbi:TRAP transporter substrate-binding protein DctP [Noviherbaspirillum sp.]|uniref:TRAP transporter substrate-binding protein DctP n=1 Tax=Noviherbaspirillum sp. TaxID=1926288 RepID=UPI002B490A9F|nr:TRAP transporter substrate-binding protein DctP [Noviherbaspirillum sp.]HJV80251.1 TRAP transporter substrate-binding protein DctP [Noviherbaspirillum sp.]